MPFSQNWSYTRPIGARGGTSGNCVQPFREWDTKPFLFAVDDLVRQEGSCNLLQQILALTTAEFESVRQLAAEIDEVIVEKDGAGFKRAHHRRAIAFHQDIILKIESRKELQRAIDRRFPPALAPQPNSLVVYVFDAHRRVE